MNVYGCERSSWVMYSNTLYRGRMHWFLTTLERCPSRQFHNCPQQLVALSEVFSPRIYSTPVLLQFKPSATCPALYNMDQKELQCHSTNNDPSLRLMWPRLSVFMLCIKSDHQLVWDEISFQWGVFKVCLRCFCWTRCSKLDRLAWQELG